MVNLPNFIVNQLPLLSLSELDSSAFSFIIVVEWFCLFLHPTAVFEQKTPGKAHPPYFLQKQGDGFSRTCQTSLALNHILVLKSKLS